MPVTTRVPPEQLTTYFDEFTRRFLRDGAPEAADIEVVSPDLGDQLVADGARLLGIAFDRRKNTFEFALDAGDHRVFTPKEVWVVEEDDHFVSAIEIVGPDGRRDVVTIKKVGLKRRDT